jgi:hypothetical protein
MIIGRTRRNSASGGLGGWPDRRTGVGFRGVNEDHLVGREREPGGEAAPTAHHGHPEARGTQAGGRGGERSIA